MKKPTPKKIKEGDIVTSIDLPSIITKVTKKKIYYKPIHPLDGDKDIEFYTGNLDKFKIIGITTPREQEIHRKHQAEIINLTQLLKKSHEKHVRWMVKEHQKELLSLAKEEHVRGYLDCARETISFLEMLEKGEVTIEAIKDHFKEAKK